MKWIASVWFALNAVAYLAYGIDKRRARKGRWRVSETTLLTLAAVGGALGAWRGMKDFRHKTRHRTFNRAIPLFMAAQAVLLGWAAFRWGDRNAETFAVCFAIIIIHLIALSKAKKKRR